MCEQFERRRAWDLGDLPLETKERHHFLQSFLFALALHQRVVGARRLVARC